MKCEMLNKGEQFAIVDAEAKTDGLSIKNIEITGTLPKCFSFLAGTDSLSDKCVFLSIELSLRISDIIKEMNSDDIIEALQLNTDELSWKELENSKMLLSMLRYYETDDDFVQISPLQTEYLCFVDSNPDMRQIYRWSPLKDNV